jgi:hypothetical protein
MIFEDLKKKKSLEKIQVSVQSEKNKGYVTRATM